MIGRSLSGCMTSIADGEVMFSEVEFIVASTRIRTEDDLDKWFEGWSESHYSWRGFSRDSPVVVKMRMILDMLWAAGKIIQPKIHGIDSHGCMYPVWVKDRDELMLNFFPVDRLSLTPGEAGIGRLKYLAILPPEKLNSSTQT